jgi:hypothetical protein
MHRTLRAIHLRPVAILIAVAVLMILVDLVGCTDNPPYRKLVLESPPVTADCGTRYEQARWDDYRGFDNPDAETDRVRGAIQGEIESARKGHSPSPCWENSVELHPATAEHPEYDLYSVEFDDQGWLANTIDGQIPQQTQLTLLMDSLNRMTGAGPEGGHPLHIVIFVHGWHHSAAADDRNVISFRRLLEHAAVAEKALCLERRAHFPDQNHGPELCDDNEQAPLWLKKRRVVGIYLGWRGDSIMGSYIENLSIWDRKLAAETVALGSVQEFFSRIHSFYQDHDCHTEQSRYRWSGDLEKCVDVRLLTAGHSFGGLITYRALAPRLMMGIAETDTDHRPAPTTEPDGGAHKSGAYAVGFGDLTVLINPAFEATRFEPLAQAAVARHYVAADPNLKQRAQLPLLIVATSETDAATGTAFPLFRRFSTPFERASGAERSTNIRTIGWESRYKTHEIKVEPDSNPCNTTDTMNFAQRLAVEAQWSERQRSAQYASFNNTTLALCDSLVLSSEHRTWSVGNGDQRPPAYMPLWIVQADKSVIDGHNDFLNDHFVDFIRQVYYTILRDGDDKMDEMRQRGQQRAHPAP